MKHNVNYFRMLEEYFDGSLNQRETSMLFEQLNRDPLLKAEFNLQLDVINSIQEARKSQLKASLNNIQVGGTGLINLNYGSYTWVAVSSGFIALLILGFFITKNQEEDLSDFKIDITDESTFEINALNTQFKYEYTATKEKAVEEISNTLDIEEQTPTRSYQADIPADNSITKIADVKEPEILTFDAEISPRSNSEAPPSSLNEKINLINKSERESVEISIDKNSSKYLSYKYFNNKLYLYGDFGKNPYELLEVVNKAKREMYLFHNDKIYYLKSNTEEISKLNEINDSKLIEDLLYLKNSQ